MAVHITEAFRQGSFLFRVGSPAEDYTLHRALVCHVSEPLSRLMNNGMSESENGLANLTSVDTLIFQKFAEWLYTMEYSTVQPERNTIVIEEEVVELSAGAAFEKPVEVVVWDEQEIQPISKKDKKLAKKAKAAQNLFEAVDPPAIPVDLITIGRFNVSSEECLDLGPNYTYLESFLIHAQLYVFADQYMIEQLMELTVHKLEHALETFNHYQHRAADVVELARYVYENTLANPRHEDVLRQLVVDRIADHFEEMMEAIAFENLMKEGGDLPGDICIKVGQRLTKQKESIEDKAHARRQFGW